MIKLTVDSVEKSALSLDELRKRKSEVVEYYNWNTKRSEVYRGVNMLDLLEKEASGIAEVELETDNGLHFFVSGDSLKQVRSILAYERADGDTFKRYSEKKKMLMHMGPLYLVWDLKGVPKEQKLYFTSIYQIRSIRIKTTKADFGLVDDGIDPKVYLGLQAYRQNCIMCHAIGNAGGSESFDLIKRQTLSLKGESYVQKFILDPRSFNPKTTMLPLPQYKNRDEVAQGIVAFLKYMKEAPDTSKLNSKTPASKSLGELKKIIQEAK